MPCWHLALYDDFAWFYNRYWNEEFHSLAFPVLERIWLPLACWVLPVAATVADRRGWLVAQAATTIALQVVLVSPW